MSPLRCCLVFGVLIAYLLMSTGVLSQNEIPVNIHTCLLQGVSLKCQWNGKGEYKADRASPNIHQLIFTRFFKPSTIWIDANKLPDLRILEVHDGDVTCDYIHAPSHVKVYISSHLCSIDSTQTAHTDTTLGQTQPQSVEPITMNEMKSTPSAEEDKTTIKVMVATSPNDRTKPHVVVSWQEFWEYKILLVATVVFVSMTVLAYFIFKIIKVYRRKKTRMTQRQLHSSSIELFTVQNLQTGSDAIEIADKKQS